MDKNRQMEVLLVHLGESYFENVLHILSQYSSVQECIVGCRFHLLVLGLWTSGRVVGLI